MVSLRSNPIIEPQVFFLIKNISHFDMAINYELSLNKYYCLCLLVYILCFYLFVYFLFNDGLSTYY